MTRCYWLRSALPWLLLAGTYSSPAAAQLDINPPLPNVLLLIDTSGSMEYMADGTKPKVCGYNDANSDMSRWHTLLTVLTGTVQERGCYQQDRGTKAWKDEFGLGNADPYDADYYDRPHYRLVSNGCVVGPGKLPKLYAWDDNSIAFHEYNDANDKCSASDFKQASDGLLDAYRDRVRFALMTFDPSKDKGTGASGSDYDHTAGRDGMWSYYRDWNNGGTPATGNLPGCDSVFVEVGARNPAAPPWEGRLIAHGPPDADIDDIRTTNDHIQLALLAMRPYGATPTAGMLSDAYTFIREDTSKDPLDSSEYFAPAKDGYTTGGCRKNVVVLLSDGESAHQLELRSDCEAVGGECPFKKAHEIAHDLANPSDPKLAVKTYAVGFGLSSAAGTDCTKIKLADFDAGGKCYTPTGALRGCCELARIAYEGGTEQAYFADDVTSLKSALSAVLAQASVGATSRTTPVFGTASGLAVVNSGADAVAWQFTSSFNPAVRDLWSGNLERHRWECKTVDGELQAELQSVDSSKGDDFVKNINNGEGSKARRFITVIGDDKGGDEYDSWASIRPKLVGDDGLGKYGGSTHDGSLASIANTLSSRPSAMDMSPMPAVCKEDSIAASSAGDCAKRVLTWLLGGTNSGGTATRDGNEFGAIYHGTPALSTPPVARVRDEDYEQFALKWQTRPVMLYSATTDGQVHAHKVAATDSKDTELVDSLKNNELWSFIPPYVLPNVLGIYPDTQKALLDGTIVVKDIVLERSLSQAKAAGTSSGANWSTILLVGGGGGGGYYVALDVTDPENPVFLWQLSRNDQDDPMFGKESAAPGIATIALADGTNVKETAVAILPGGSGKKVKGKSCKARKQQDFSHVKGKYKPRTQARCWDAGTDRTLTIVRIKDGLILRVLADDKKNVAKGIESDRITEAPFDSPLTGIPVAYPSQPGQVANRIYVGDADGGLYRVDLSETDPAKWSADLIWDAYPLSTDDNDEGEPVQGWPVVSVDEFGNTVIIYSTGDQELLTSKSGMKNRIWSLLEKPVKTANTDFSVEPNWFLPFSDGKRVTGPISVFDGVTYFATYTPASASDADACSAGYGSIWGVSYKANEDEGAGPRPLARLPKDPDAETLTFTDELKQDAGSVVFGVSVQMEPPCVETSEVDDTYVGKHTAISNSSPPKYNLMFHTGNAGKVHGGSNAKTKASTVQLANPRNLVRIDSWASVGE